MTADAYVFSPDDFRHDEIDRYYNTLADVYPLGPSQDEKSDLLSLRKKSFLWFSSFLSWKQNWRRPCNRIFRLLADETHGNRTVEKAAPSTSVKDNVVSTFPTSEELNHFVKKLNVRMGRGIRLDAAVSTWLDENHSGKCVIS